MTTTVRKAASVFMAVLLCLGVAFSAAPGIFGGTAYAYTLGGPMTDGATLTVSGAQEGGKVDAIKMFDAVPTADGDGATYTVASEWSEFFSSSNLDDYNNDSYVYVQGLEDEEDKTKIAEFAAKAVKWMGDKSFAGTTVNVQDGGTATLSGLDYGYYLVLPYGAGADSPRYSDAMLVNVLKDSESATVKAEWPTVDKTVQTEDNGNFEDNGSAQVGDTVTFKLTSKVPDMSGYDKYTFSFVDTMSNGLTFVKTGETVTTADVTVTIGGQSVTTGYSVSLDGQELTVSFDDLKSVVNTAGANKGDGIVVTYKAMINESATSVEPATNEAKVEYSNDPSTNETGTSIPDQTKVYTYDINVHKYAFGNNEGFLAGAKFVLSTSDTLSNIETDENIVKLIGANDDYRVAKPNEVSAVTSFMTNGTGLINIDGLEAGTYYLHEIEAPAGYNKLADPVKIEITVSDSNYGTPSYTVDDGNQDTNKEVKIENSKGALLPTTGGMGTIGLTVLGVIIVAAGAIWVVRRNRKGNQR